jgi:hypothetical protein
MERYSRTQRVIFRLFFAGRESGLFGRENPLKMLILHRMKEPLEARKKRPKHDRIQIHMGLAQVV